MRAFAPAPLAMLLLSGCCGGYSVVETKLGSEGGSHVLQYSRVGEPPNACGSDLKYVEDLVIRVPSLRPGATFALGHGGASATYSRTKSGPAETSERVSGKVSLVEQASDGLVASLDIRVVLASGEVVTVDDSYTFHPTR